MSSSLIVVAEELMLEKLSNERRITELQHRNATLNLLLGVLNQHGAKAGDHFRTDEYRGLRIAEALRKLLEDVGGSLPVNEAVMKLQQGGCALKGRPDLNVKFAAVSGK